MNQRMLAAARSLDVCVQWTFPTGAEIALTGADVLGFAVEEGADSPLLPGAVLCAQLTMDLADGDGRWHWGGSLRGERPMVGSTARVFLSDGGERLPCGVFVITAVSAREHGGCVRVTGCDSIAAELGAVFEDELTYPATLGQVWDALAAQTRYAWSGALPNGSAVVDAKPDWKGASLRRAAGWIAQAAGCFVRVDREGALELVDCVGGAVEALGPEAYMTLDDGCDSFGPVAALQVLPVGAEETFTCADGDGETLSIRDNPLFQAGAAGLDALARGTLERLKGLTLNRAAFRWRGDPSVGVGAHIALTDTFGQTTLCTVTRQTLRFEGGFSAECFCETPRRDDSGVMRAITPEGGVNAAALVGVVDGGLLAVGSVTARKIAAGSITAEKIAAGSVSADKIAAGSVTAEKVAAGAITAEKIAAGAVSAQSIEAVTAALGRLTAGEIQTDRLYAALAHVIELAAVSISAGQVETDQLAAALARVVTLQAGTGSFDFATVQNLVAGAMSLELGCAGTVAVKNLLVSSANLLNAVIGGLVLKSANGKYYTVTVGSDGVLGAEETTVSAGEIAAGVVSDGRSIVETSANIENLAAGTILGQRAVLNSILTTALTAGSITASEALLASASVPALYTTAIRAIGNSLDLSANESIRLIVGQAEESASRIFRQEEAPEGARDGDLWIQPSLGRTWQYCAGAAAAPVFALGEDGQLAYGYADGETVWPLRINDDGWLEMDADAPFQFDQDHTGSVWLLVVDTDMIDSRLTSAESAIVQTADQIELTVKRVDTVQTAVGTAQSTAESAQSSANSAQSTANSAQSTANSAQSAANANASNLSALTTRVTAAESSITQNANQIALTVKNVETVQTAVTTAQSAANSAQSAANSKRRVFVSTPAPPYDAGDLWVQGTSGDIMRCQTAKASGGSYAASDWVRASKYTDDTAANAAQSVASSAQSTANSAQSAANANASNISALTTRVSASETAISQNASAISLRATKAELSALETRVETAEIAVEPDSIAAVVKKKVAFGGTNLALNSAFKGLSGAGVYSFDGDVAVFSSSVTGVTANILFALNLSGDIAQARGREITFSMDYRVDGAVSYGASQPWVGAQLKLIRSAGNLFFNWYGNTGFPTAVTGKWMRYAQTFSVSDAEISSGQLFLIFRDASGTVRFRHPKLEIGGVATEWSPSPEDPGQSLNTYSGVRIDQDEIHLVSAKTTIAVPGSSGEDDVARFDSEGVHAQIVEADTINSPSVVAAQGAAMFAPANAGELAAIGENLRNVCLTGDVTINTSALTGGTLNLTGVSGGYTLTVYGGTLNGASIVGCAARIVFISVTFATSGAALTLDDGRNVVVSGGALNAGTGVLARRGSRIRVDSCGGVCDYAAYSRELSEVTFTGTAPGTDMPYGAAQTALGGQIYAGARLIPKPSSEPEPEKPTVQTVTLTPTLTRSWNGSWRDGYWLFQGRYGTKNLNRGCMWFSTSDFAGKTIISAALSMKRKTGAGKGSAVTVKICGTTATGASGTPTVGTQYASVSIGRNERRSVDVTSAVKALASGSIKGLMLYDSSTSNISSSDPYTEGYAQLYGSDSGDRPVLTVTYQ